jgi:hypothetical protein
MTAAIWLSQERWHHIVAPMNHPEMALYEEQLKETIQSGYRRQDALNPQRYRYVKGLVICSRATPPSSRSSCFGLVKVTTGSPFRPTTSSRPSGED